MRWTPARRERVTTPDLERRVDAERRSGAHTSRNPARLVNARPKVLKERRTLGSRSRRSREALVELRPLAPLALRNTPSGRAYERGSEGQGVRFAPFDPKSPAGRPVSLFQTARNGTEDHAAQQDSLTYT